MRKRLTKTIWYGSGVDSSGNPILPSANGGLDGLNYGELFLHLSNSKATLWTLSSEGKIVEITGGGSDVDMSSYLLKSIWDKAFEFRTDKQGVEYIFSKLPVVAQYGITMYAGNSIDIPSLASGLPFDNKTIWYNPSTNQIEVIGGTGGGGEGGVSNFWDLNNIPSWITMSKPKYTYSEIEGTPDLTQYALVSQIPSLSGYATESWVLQKNYATKATTLSGYGITDAYTKTNVDDLLKSYVTLGGTQTITGEKNFTGGLKVNGNPIYYDTEKKYWKLEGDLLVTGGVTMYGDSVSGGSAGATTLGQLQNVGTWADSVADVDRIMYQTAGSSNWVSKNLSDLELKGDYLPLSGGTLSGSIRLTNNSYLFGSVAHDTLPDKEGYLTVFHINNATILGAFGNGTTPNIATYIRSTGDNLYHRQGKTSAYKDYRIWDEGNLTPTEILTQLKTVDGSGSGLDADLLDGKHYSDIIKSNVASANKLKNPRTIWGQSFDGTGDVDGNLYGNSKENANEWNIYRGEEPIFRVANAGLVISPYDKTNGFIALRTGKNAETNGSKELRVYSTGNVLIGTTTDSGYKLDVNGSTQITGSCVIRNLTNYTSLTSYGINGGYKLYAGYKEDEYLRIDTTNSSGGYVSQVLQIDKNDYVSVQKLNVGAGLNTNNRKAEYRLGVYGTLGVTGVSTFRNDVSIATKLTLADIPISKSQDDVLYIDANVVVRGGITMYGTNTTSVPSILDSLPIASTTTKGIASFDSNFFSVGSDGKVTFIGQTGGGVADSVAWANVTGKPDWIGTSKPSYTLNEIGSGILTIGDATNRIMWRTSSIYSSGVYYNKSANESVVFANKYRLTSWIFANTDPTLQSDWQNLTPSLQIKNQRVVINKLIPTGQDSEYNLDVNGSFNATTGYINKNEILHAGNYSSYALPLSGGTINGSGDYIYVPLFINALNNSISGITFKTNGTERGHVGYSSGLGIRLHSSTTAGIAVSDNNVPIFYTGDGSVKNTIWHSGNDGSGSGLDADLLDGYHVDSLFKGVYDANINFNSFSDDNNINNFYYIHEGLNQLNRPYDYGGLLQLGISTMNVQVGFDHKNAACLRTRWWSNNGYDWNSWREFAFTDSNVASATKLQTARTIWGQSFDGTGDIGGNCVVTGTLTTNQSWSDGASIHIKENRNDGAGGYQAIRFYYNNDNQAVIHYFYNNYNGFAWTKKNLNLGGQYITLGDWDNPVMLVDDVTRNVGIGTINPVHKLHVKGVIYSEDVIQGTYLYASAVTPTSNPYENGRLGVFDRNGGFVVQFGTSTKKSGFEVINQAWSNVLFSVSQSGNVTAAGGITMYSDQRKKTIINHVELSLKDIANAPLVEHYYNSDDTKTTHVGSIAQYWASMNDWFCKLDSEGFYTMEIQNCALASAISIARELDRYESKTDKTIKQLKKRICQLEEEVERLRAS